MQKEIIKQLNKTDVYTLNLENWWIEGSKDPKTEIVSAYSSDGGYIGNLDELIFFVGKRGIHPQKKTKDSNVCSIGFNKEEQKWYGWSHRAIFGFGIGHITKEGDSQTISGWTEEYLEEHPEERLKVIPVGFECKTLEDCKKVAVAFADSVS